MKIVAVYSIKGGVGKTAAAVNLADKAADSGLKTLVWDLDPQAAATFYFRVKPKLRKKIKKAVQGKYDIENEIKGTDFNNLDIIPADFSYRKLDIFLNNENKPEKTFRSMFQALSDEYDIVFLDSPPGVSILSETVLNVCDVLLVPMIPTTLSARTTELLDKFIKDKDIKKLNPVCFYSMVDRRKKLHRDTLDSHSDDGRFLDTHIPQSSDIEKMGLNRAPVSRYAKASRGAKAYADLWNEVYNLL